MKELIAKCEKSSLSADFKAWLKGLKADTPIAQVKALAKEAQFSTECQDWLEQNANPSGKA